MKSPRTVYIHTIGCRLNQADSALLYGRLASEGYIPAANSKNAAKDLIIVNTCCVTASAVQKCRKALRRLRRENPDAIIAVTGCDAELNEKSWASDPSCDMVIPGSKKRDIVSLLRNSPKTSNEDGNVFFENAEAHFPFRSRAMVKIQEGCDAFCAYCLVPFARGRPRSRASDEIISECRRLVNAGCREIVLTGVNICRYAEGGMELADLVERILLIQSEFRLRLSSTEPDGQLRRILSIMKDDPRLCRFLHVPLQHGSDRILRAMRRRYEASDFAAFAEMALSTVSGLHLGTDIICGLPGESEEIFRESLDFIATIPFANIHIFRYSPRKGTDAAGFSGRPSPIELRERMALLESLKARLADKFIDLQLGKRASFIGEKRLAGGSIVGWSDNYIRTYLNSDIGVRNMLNVRFTGRRNGLALDAQPETGAAEKVT